MVQSEIRNIDGKPTLTVNGKATVALAYMSYLLEKSRYEDFSAIGYNLYSVPLLFSDSTINEKSRLPPFSKGIYTNIYTGEAPNYGLADRAIEAVLKHSPNAYIFPRINVSVPAEWENRHLEECCDFSFGEHKRACFSSDLWAEEVKRLLVDFISHVERSWYKDHIIGYQISGGNTEEWFSFDLSGSIGKRSREGFEKFCSSSGAEKTESEYYGYLSSTIAKRLCEFAHTVKECVQGRLVVGTFYGYTLECPFRTSIHHALNEVLSCKDVDFICSPVSYGNFRSDGADHANMLPLDSLKLHGKLYFAECDQRTHLTMPPNDLPVYNTWIWKPVEKSKTIEIFKMLFARAITHQHALWWFDMWGGWYADRDYLQLMHQMREIAEASLDKRGASVAEVAVFIDEKAYKTIDEKNPKEDQSIDVGKEFRLQLGLAGAPYDIYLASDFREAAEKYKAFVFLIPCDSQLASENIRLAKETDIPFLIVDKKNFKMPVEELRNFYKDSHVTLYTDKPAVVYASESYLFLHTAEETEYDFKASGKSEFTDIYTGETYRFPMKLPKGKSLLFER